MLGGRYTPAIDDVKAVARPVLRHRIVTNFAAEAENVKPDAIVRRLVDEL
jgi:MoxR-like ATPase